jgi:hypothetical protein
LPGDDRHPFTYLDHLVTLPVRVADVEARFVLDTGSARQSSPRRSRAESAAPRTARVSRASAWSGRKVGVPLAEAPRIALGSYVRDGDVVGVLDTTGFPDTDAAIDGFPSLAFFEETAFTVDYQHSLVGVDTRETLAERVAHGVAVPVRLERRGPALVAFLHLSVPGLGSIEVEVDIGSDSLISTPATRPRSASASPTRRCVASRAGTRRETRTCAASHVSTR